MAIREHPELGTVLMCNFGAGFTEPEMVKHRPVVVISPKIRARPGLCTIVALSTTEPDPVLPYHCQIDLSPSRPKQFQRKGIWVKGDMVNAVGFHRLDLIRLGKDRDGRRKYLYEPLCPETIRRIRTCVLHELGLSILTRGL